MCLVCLLCKYLINKNSLLSRLIILKRLIDSSLLSFQLVTVISIFMQACVQHLVSIILNLRKQWGCFQLSNLSPFRFVLCEEERCYLPFRQTEKLSYNMSLEL